VVCSAGGVVMNIGVFAEKFLNTEDYTVSIILL
jgi:hypothetical protein